MYNQNVTLANIITPKILKMPVVDIVQDLIYLVIRYDQDGEFTGYSEHATNMSRELMPLLKAIIEGDSDQKKQEAVYHFFDCFGLEQILINLDEMLKYSFSNHNIDKNKNIYNFYMMFHDAKGLVSPDAKVSTMH
jgi:hypothetical protein